MQRIPVYPPGTIVQAKVSNIVTTPSDFAIGYRNPISPWLDPTLAVEMVFLNHFNGIITEVEDARNRLKEVPLVYKELSHLTSYRVRVGDHQFWFRWTELEESKNPRWSEAVKMREKEGRK